MTPTNESIGISAEYACCLLFNTPNELEEKRIDYDIVDSILRSTLIDLFLDNNLQLTKHIGKGNGSIDFVGICENDTEYSVSLKTIMGKGDGKICPQGGQMTYCSFHKHFPGCPRPTDDDRVLANPNPYQRVNANKIRWNWIKENIGLFLNRMQSQTFCCDFTIFISNCRGSPVPVLLVNPCIDFAKINISYKREDYVERCRKDENKEPAEFSTIIYGEFDGTNKKIGEFQFHKKKIDGSGRNNIKFRFYKSLFCKVQNM